MKIIRTVALCLACLGSTYSFAGSPQQTKKPFTVSDEIGLRFFGGGEGNRGSTELAFSPDGSYVAIDTERGLLDRQGRPIQTLA
jgi:hypothetical protein